MSKLKLQFHNSLEIIAESRIGFARESRSASLDLKDLGLTQLPKSIGGLPYLQELNISGNKLRTLPETIGHMSNLKVLAAHGNVLKTLPKSIGQLSQLESLSLTDNHLTELPSDLCQLSELTHLALGCNPITRLPDSLGLLSNLQYLDLNVSECVILEGQHSRSAAQLNRRVIGCLESLPDSIKELKSLVELYLHGQLKIQLPPEVLGPTWSVINSGLRTMQRSSPAQIIEYYFKTRSKNSKSRPLNEAKMIIVGRGGAGKTSLVNRLVHGTYNATELKTDGIAITPWNIKTRNDNVKLNIWDFGGQEIMHSTHQFFLTKRSLYLLVLNAREGEQDTNVEYWLRLIESFGGDSPVIVIINKIAEHYFDLNRRGLQVKFSSIRGFFQVDCATGIGIEKLRKAIFDETERLEHLHDLFPESWFKVKENLADMRQNEGKSYIPFSRYQELCHDKGVTEPTSQETLVGFLHDLGIVVNFRDNPRLSETQVLDPEWVTNGIYNILNAELLAINKGELHLEELSKFLNCDMYPRIMHQYLVDLMRKFELCYAFYDSALHYLVPELLGKNEPDLKQFAAEDALRFEYEYNILPEGLLPRFIVRSRALNKDLPQWRSGVVLTWDGNFAVVKADVQDKRVRIAITGPVVGRRRLLAVIRVDLEHIHGSIAKLEVAERVPVPNYPGLLISYKKLLAFETNNIGEIIEEHGGKIARLKVADLLYGVEGPIDEDLSTMRKTAPRRAVRIVFSYSHKDEELRDQLETHLKLLRRQGVISMWHDRRINPGDKWADVIDDNFKRADLILLLVSADFLASDYCYEIEMRIALARDAKKDARVVPILLRACDWKGSPFGKLQGLPEDMKAVTSWSNRDEAWANVANGIRLISEELCKSEGSKDAG